MQGTKHHAIFLTLVLLSLQGCASVKQGKSPSVGANAVLNQASTGRAASPRHNLREWRLEVDTGGFVQLILSSSGFYMMRHGYFFMDQSAGSDKTLMLSEANIGKYVVRGNQVMMASPLKSTCKLRVGQNSAIVLDSTNKGFLMDETATRNFVFDDFKGRKELPFFKQQKGTLDGSSPLPMDEQDPDGRFQAKLGCVQMKPDGQISFVPPDKQEGGAAQGVAH